MADQVGGLVLGGYKATYLTELNLQGNRMLIWKISYEKKGNDMLAKLVMIDGKVAGFWLQ